jgi:chemotaxis protein CheD
MTKSDMVLPLPAWQEAEVLPLENGRPFVYLHPGQLHVSAGVNAIKTLLGSCVAVCLWDPRTQVGGMVHFLLPHAIEPHAEPGRYGDLAVPALIKGVRALGARREDLRAKVFGGGCVLPVLVGRSGSLGDSNAQIAFDLLAAEGIPVLARDVGGERGRRVLFHVDDGSAWVWKLGVP